MGRLFDFILGMLKWPVAVCSLFYLPAMFEALGYVQFNNLKFFALLGGVFAYVAIKILASARSNVSMQILAHEFTHIFFAWLTFHKVVHIHLNPDESGGAMGFKGKGNWLIVITPYFFPLFLFFLMLFFTFYGDKIPQSLWVNGVFGYFFAYHLETVVVQIHGQQPDFKEVGYPFCWMFLPGANLFVCSAIVSFNNGGWEAVMKYSIIVYKLGLRYFTNL